MSGKKEDLEYVLQGFMGYAGFHRIHSLAHWKGGDSLSNQHLCALKP